MKIMHTMSSESNAQRRKRRYYPPELKNQIVAECQVSGASVAGVALSHGINANILHRWMREQADAKLPAPRHDFVALSPDGQVKFPHPWPPQIPPDGAVGL